MNFPQNSSCIPKQLRYSKHMIKCSECKSGPLKGGLYVGDKGPLCNLCCARLKEVAEEITCTQCGAKMPNDAYARRYGRCARHVDEERAGNISEDEDRSVEPFPHVSERERGMSHPAFGDIRLPLKDRPDSPPQSREDKLRTALESYVALHGMSVLAKEALEAE